MNPKCKTLKSSYQEQVSAQYSQLPLKAPLRAVLSLWHGTRRTTDIDNFNKLVLDALTGLVYEDDSQIVELTITKGYNKERPRVDVTIEAL